MEAAETRQYPRSRPARDDRCLSQGERPSVSPTWSPPEHVGLTLGRSPKSVWLPDENLALARHRAVAGIALIRALVGIDRNAEAERLQPARVDSQERRIVAA